MLKYLEVLKYTTQAGRGGGGGGEEKRERIAIRVGGSITSSKFCSLEEASGREHALTGGAGGVGKLGLLATSMPPGALPLSNSVFWWEG